MSFTRENRIAWMKDEAQKRLLLLRRRQYVF